MIFASATPVPRETLSGLVGPDCRLDDLIADIQAELRGRPYELAFVAGGWQHRTRPRFADAIRASRGEVEPGAALAATENLVVTAIAYLQPVTRAELARLLGREVSRDTVARLKRLGFAGAGPRMPALGAPLTYVTTGTFLSVFGLGSLRELPDIEALEEAGLLARASDLDSCHSRVGCSSTWMRTSRRGLRPRIDSGLSKAPAEDNMARQGAATWAMRCHSRAAAFW